MGNISALPSPGREASRGVVRSLQRRAVQVTERGLGFVLVRGLAHDDEAALRAAVGRHTQVETAAGAVAAAEATPLATEVAPPKQGEYQCNAGEEPVGDAHG